MPTLTGIVNPVFKALVRIVVRGPQGAEQTVEAMVDTGFNRILSLPLRVIEGLDLPLAGERTVKLANGTTETIPVYRARILWEGYERPVSVLASGDEPLLGMGALVGYRLCIEVTPDGELTIEPLT